MVQQKLDNIIGTTTYGSVKRCCVCLQKARSYETIPVRSQSNYLFTKFNSGLYKQYNHENYSCYKNRPKLGENIHRQAKATNDTSLTQ